MVDGSSIRERYAAVSRDLNERARRLFGAAEARTAGHGGITASSRATGLARSTIGRGLKDLDFYNVIYADPPWRFEPYSRETGMDRAADNHYPTMTTDELCALEIPSSHDCILFLWATAPMLREALRVMEEWGFNFRSHWIWLKDRIGTGYWAAISTNCC